MAIIHVNDISGRIIGAAIEVHRELGPGLMESTYESCLAEEMTLGKLTFSRQHHFLVLYKNRVIRSRYRLDFLVLNFNVVAMKGGIRRVVHGHPIALPLPPLPRE